VLTATLGFRTVADGFLVLLAPDLTCTDVEAEVRLA
jgi:hypothetical protein